MIVWGGCDQDANFCDVSSGGRYDPLTDNWTDTNFSNVPVARMNHTAVWTGSQMIVWAGCSIGLQENNYCNIQRNDGSVIDIDGPALAITGVGSPDLGSVVISGTAVIYTPSADLNGTDSFTYTVSDGSLQDVGLVTVEVTPVNDAPAAIDDAYVALQDAALVVPVPGVLANDSDVEGDALSAVLAAEPQHGSLVLEADGSFVYTPDAGYSGADEFGYQAGDRSLLSIPSVSITVITSPPGLEQTFYLPIVRR